MKGFNAKTFWASLPIDMAWALIDSRPSDIMGPWEKWSADDFRRVGPGAFEVFVTKDRNGVWVDTLENGQFKTSKLSRAYTDWMLEQRGYRLVDSESANLGKDAKKKAKNKL